MSELLDADTVVDYLAGRGLAEPGARAEPLGGGVSNVVLAVSSVGSGGVVLKQALPKLRVADEWTAPQSRALTEADALTLAATLTPGWVPPVVDSDPERHTVVLEHAPDGWLDWKRRLLDGYAEPAVADRLGELLADWHSATRTSASIELPERLHDVEPFELLRVDPYYRTVARRAPEIAAPVLAMVDELAANRRCLVHGDFSPKNVLVDPVVANVVRPGRLWVIDFEVAHIGDPAFDLAFMSTHLALKAIHRPHRASAYDACAVAFVEAYDRRIDQTLAPDWSYVLRHVGCLLLARVRGKSPAEYLTSPEQDLAWRLGADVLTDPPDHPTELVARRKAFQV